MSHYFVLVRRELASFFASVTGYVIIAMVALLLGVSFSVLLEALNREPTDMPVTDLFYKTFYFWLVLLISAPVITMRTFALEKSSGTYETLMTTPVSDVAVVLAKFTGSLIFYLIMWVPLAVCIAVVRAYSSDPSAVDPGPMASTLLGILLVGALYISLGCFASALTRSQIIAAMTSFALGIALFLLSFLSYLGASASGWKKTLIEQLSMVDHMQEFVRGVVDTRYVVFYASLTACFLFFTVKAVESRRWR